MLHIIKLGAKVGRGGGKGGEGGGEGGEGRGEEGEGDHSFFLLTA